MIKGGYYLIKASSSSVSYSPFCNFLCNKNFYLDILAFYYLPGCSSSQDLTIAFSLSSFTVSLTTATVSEDYTLRNH